MSGTPEELPEGTDGVILARGDAETARVGADLANGLEPGDVVLLTGEVGAGKSTLIRAAMRGLGVEGTIPSPTFTIGRLYEGAGQSAPVAHLDLYRLGGSDYEDPGLLSEYFGPDRITFIEWSEGRGEELAAGATRIFRVTVEHVDESSRRVRVEPPG
jgi:tRNA threonylcarbamoyladenosine biosynthesis protein TsaE